MRSAATPPSFAPASLWLRLHAAERARLWIPAAADERMVWMAGAGPMADSTDGVLELGLSNAQSIAGGLRCAAEGWPLRDDSVDRVVLQHVLERVATPELLLDEALRVLKPERSVIILFVAAFGWTRFRLRWPGSGAPSLAATTLSGLRESLLQRDCVDLQCSRITFDGGNAIQTRVPARPWSGLCMIEARKRRELPNVRPLGARRRDSAPASGWIARPTSRNGLAA